MFGKHTSKILLLIAVAALALPMVGCESGKDTFAELDANKDGYLTVEELDSTGDNFITPSEIKSEGKTYARGVQTFFRHGDSGDDQKLDREEFAHALRGESRPPWQIALILVLVVGVPIPIGFQLGKMLRMPDHGWKIALILLSITAGATITYFGWPPKLGIDLSGGVILIYEIDEEATAEQLAAEPAKKEDAEKEMTSSERFWRWLGMGPEEGQPRTLTAAEEINADELVQQLRRRINPGGVKEIVVRPYGPKQVEIIIPEVDAAEVEFIKRRIEKTGQLEFFIVATPRDDELMIEKAEKNIADPQRLVKNADGETIGRWVPVGVQQKVRGEEQDYRGVNPDDILRARTGRSQEFKRVDVNNFSPQIVDRFRAQEINLKQAVEAAGFRDLQVLMEVNPTPERNVKGNHLFSAKTGFDNVGEPAVHFTMTRPGAALLGRLTGAHQPNESGERTFYYRMAIVMDGEVISAPRLLSPISDNGQITGDFSQEEVEELAGILKAGRLPAVMRKDPISENEVSALLGYDTIRSGAFAISLSLVAVLIFMGIYYRFAGIVACIALLLNLLLILALMILVKAAFTLPGLAGLVLTVGMSVDANVLIYERIREELARGSALRMAIRNGFGRATTTIVDANLTTLITAIVLYVIGTDQIRGFAVTLILGILMSMYTAIFCSRVIFDIAERRRWIRKLSMAHILGETHWNLIGKSGIAITCSLVLIAVGLLALVARGKGLFDIDFNGGTSVEVLMSEPMAIADFRKTAEGGALGDVSVTGVHFERDEADKNGADRDLKPGEFEVFIVNSSITGEGTPDVGDPVNYTPPGQTDSIKCDVTSVDIAKETADLKARLGDATFDAVPWKKFERDGVEIVQKKIKDLFPGKLELRSLQVDKVASAAEDNGKMPDVPDVPAAEEDPAKDTSDQTGALSDDGPFKLTSFQADETVDEAADPADLDDPPAATTDDNPDAAELTDPPAAPQARPSLTGKSTRKLTFGQGMTADSVRALVRPAVHDLYGDIDLPPIILRNPDWDGLSSQRFRDWEVEIAVSDEAADQIFQKMQNNLKDTPVWLQSNKIGGQVAGNMQRTAIGALLGSLLGIIGYIWFRFQRVVFGLAAVVALVHDVLITLGAIAASLWLSHVFGFLLIDEFKISLPIVAALLTIIGYSLNDTIVVFDRIREVRGKNPDLTADMINTSINQTLSRTLLTSVTTLIVVGILYVLGGQAIRGFAFALMIGVVVGTYSSIFIASPFLLWMMNATKAKKSQATKSKATT